MHRELLAGIAVLFTALGCATSAKAQVNIAGSHYEAISGIATCNGNHCVAPFPQLPADKYTHITRVTCTIVSSQPVVRMQVGIRSTPASFSLMRWQYLEPSLTANVAGNLFHNLNDAVDLLAGKGRYPAIAVVTVGAADPFIECTIAGTLLDQLPAAQ